MLRHAFYSCVFVLSFTAAHAEQAKKSYFGVSAVIDGELSYDSPLFVDSNFGSGFILSYGYEIDDNIALEIAHARYQDSGADGVSYLNSELTAFEISGTFRAKNGAPFVRLGYSDGKLKGPVIDLNTATIIDTLSESESGPLIGLGFDVSIKESNAAIRFEYSLADYDEAELTRLTIGTLVRF